MYVSHNCEMYTCELCTLCRPTCTRIDVCTTVCFSDVPRVLNTYNPDDIPVKSSEAKQ